MKNFTFSLKKFHIGLVLLLTTSSFSQTILNSETFEINTGIWAGTTNALRQSASPYQGTRSLRFTSNSTTTSVATTNTLNILPYNKVDIKFFVSSTVNSNETLTLRYRPTAASAWVTVRTITKGTSGSPRDVNTNNEYYVFYATMFSTDYTFSTTGQFQFYSNIGSTSRYWYVDNVSISGTTYNTITNSPGGISAHLETWLRADRVNGSGVEADNQPVNKWEDTGRGHDAFVADGDNAALTNKPLYKNNSVNNINFNPVVSFNNDPSTSALDYTGLNNRAEMHGTSGFYTHEQYIVVVNDNPPTVNSSTASVDIYCAQGSLTTPYDRDGTGFGFGQFTIRFTNEVISYCHGSTPTNESTAVNSRGYGVAQAGTGISYTDIPAILSIRNNAATATGQDLHRNALQIDNTEVGVPQFANYSNRRYWLGRSQVFDGSFGGRIAEIITYSARKTDGTERRKIESYLAIKYGVTLGTNGTSMNYVNSNGTTIWNATADPVFNYNIAGIGRDDISQLNQKQSKTVNTTADITIGLAQIAATNSANTSSFVNNREFLVWGNDNGSLAAQPPVVVNMSSGIPGLTTNVDFISIDRTWKVVETGGDIPSVKISIPSSLLTATITPPGDFLMFISNSPVFNPTSEYRVLRVNGTELETDYDFDGTKYITFGYAPQKTFVRSISFDGINDYLDAGDVLNLSNNFTVSAWIKRSGTDQSILSKRNSTFTGGYDLKINSSGMLEMSWMNGSKQTITSTVAVPANIWHNVAVTYDGTTARLYIDGVLDVTKSLSTVPATTHAFIIAAADKYSTTSFFAGGIDEVRVFDKVLSEAELRFIMNQEISEHSNASITGKILPQNITLNEVADIPWNNLQAYYPMSTYTFTNAKDQSRNNYTAALKNLTTVDHQTAPLPYISIANGSWTDAAVWQNSNVQDLPYSISIIDVNLDPSVQRRVTGNIVQSLHNIESTTNKVLLGLDVQSGRIDVTNSKMEVSHYLKLDGIIDLKDTSQLIQTINSDLDPASAGKIERDQQGTANIFNYNYWSSPVGAQNTTTNNNNYTISSVLKDGTNPNDIKDINWISSYDGLGGSPISLSSSWIYKFQNIAAEYANWTFIGSGGNLRAGEGFTMKGSGAAGTSQNYTFTGKPNNGLITLAVGAGFLNLCGNPYPSALDGHAFIDANIGSINGTLLFWEHFDTNQSHNLADYQGGYAALTKVGGTPPVAPPGISGLGSSSRIPKRFIPVGQGFFVTGNITGGSITFNNNQRGFVRESNTLSNVMFRNSQAPHVEAAPAVNNGENSEDFVAESSFMKLRLGFNCVNNYHRQILMGFMNQYATSGIDAGFDAELFDDFPNDIYFINGTSKLVIQGEGYFDPSASYPLGIKTNAAGNIEIMLDEQENFGTGQDMFIYDADTGLYHEISDGSVFTIAMAAGVWENRFSLRFQDSTLGTQIPQNNVDLEIAYSQQNNLLSIKSEVLDMESASVFNMLGQDIAHETFTDTGKVQNLTLSNLSSGTYIVKITTPVGSYSRKFIVR